MFATLVFYVIPTDYDNRLVKMAEKIEVWSVSNPTSFLSQKASFPVQKFLDESGKVASRSITEYDVHRFSLAGKDFICFMSTSEENRAYSYTDASFVDSEICGN